VHTVSIISPLENKIKNARLTKTERRIADFFLDNLTRICFMTAEDISVELGVSDASVIRFVRSLGYTGFSELKKSIQTQLSKHLENSTNEQSALFERLTRITPYLTDDDLVQSMMKVMMRNFKDTFKRNEMKRIGEISQCLIASRRKYIIGPRGNQDLAFMAAHLFAQTLPGVHPVLYSDVSPFDPLLDIDRRDCALFFSFPRYSGASETSSLFVKKSRAKRIVVTDKVTSPIAAGADIILTAGLNNISFNNSRVIAVFLIELISADITRKIGTPKVTVRLKKYNDLNPLHGSRL
jgi:DNA-binding MurR/RpiR family transcriptional regulator